MSQLTHRYATALFELAQEMNTIDTWQTQMNIVHSVFAENKEYISFFGHYRVADNTKKDVIKNVFKDKLDKEVLKFLLLILYKKLIKNVIGIAMSFNTLCNESKNIKEGIVYSVKTLELKDKEQIEASVGKHLDCTIELKNRIDKSLISGIKVVVGDQVIDGSLRNRMNSLKTELLKESR